MGLSRIARVVVPGLPYDLTHRGNRRAQVFVDDEDREVYLALVGEYARKHGLELWAYCLMTNHVHWLVVPHQEDSMALGVGTSHMRYSRWLNRKMGWSGHLWANRYHSTCLDGEHLWNAIRYIEQNPLRARMIDSAAEYPWSSTRGHAQLQVPSGLLSADDPFPGHVGAGDWVGWVNAGLDERQAGLLRKNTLSGRPTGSEQFVADLERRLGRILQEPRMGRPRRRPAEKEVMEDLFA